MPSASYIDITALDAIRTRFAAGEAVAVLSPALDRVIWANGAGAALFGYSDVAAITGAEPQIGLPAKRQIMATSGYPRIGKNRAITVRLASGLMSRAVAFAASEIVLPDGEQAILLAHAAPAASWRSPAEAAARAIAGLDLPGQPVAIVDAEGGVVAASPDFAGLELKTETFLPLIAEARGERLAKRAVETSYGAFMAGVLRLADEPRSHFLLAIDEALPADTTGSPAEQAGDAAIPAAAAEAAVVGATVAEHAPAEADRGEVQPDGLGDEPAAPPVEPQPSSEALTVSAEQTEQPDTALATAEALAEPIAAELPVAAAEASEPPTEASAAPVEKQRPLAGGSSAEHATKESEPAPADRAGQPSREHAAEDRAAAESGHTLDGLSARSEIEAEPSGPAASSGTEPVAEAREIQPAAGEDGVRIEDSQFAAVDEAEREAAETLATVPDTESPATPVVTEPGHQPEVGQAKASDPAAGEDGGKIEDSQFAAVDEAEREAAESVATLPDTEMPATPVQAEPEPEPDLDQAEPSDTAAVDDAITEAGPAPLPHITVDRSAAPVTFVWKTDAADRFSEIGEDFVKAVGEPAADVIGTSFRDAAARLGIDPAGEIAGLIERRAPWSGRAVSWPVAGTDLRVPVDLAALPTYDRDRNFTGFRGFGVARAADAVVDPDAAGLKLVEPLAAEQTAETPDPKAEPAVPDGDAPRVADPFRGEPPILTIVPKPERRLADKVIRLAEHRYPVIDKNLSPGERSAFREIGDRLKKEDGAPNGRGSSEQPRHADNDAARSGGADAGPDRAKDGEGEEPRPAALVEAPPEQAAAEAQPAAQPAVEAAIDAPEPTSPETTEPVGDAERQAEPGSEDAPRTAEQSAAVEPSAAEPDAAAEAGPEPADALPSIAETSDADQPMVEPAPGSADAMTDVAESPSATTGGEEPAGTIDEAEPAALAVKDYIPSAFALGAAGRRAPIDTSILDKLPVPVLIHSADVLHYANREFLELTGYDDVEELQAAGGLDALFGEPYPADDDDDEEGAEPGRKLRLRTNEGLEYPVEAFLQSVPWGDGKSLLLSLRRSLRHPVSYPARPPAPRLLPRTRSWSRASRRCARSSTRPPTASC